MSSMVMENLQARMLHWVYSIYENITVAGNLEGNNHKKQYI